VTTRRVPAVLSIAGSDSGGGAGIQADLKAFARCGVHGMTAITAITAQNTVGVRAVEVVPPETIVAQVMVVIDPVMVAESGAVLLDQEAQRALVEQLLPLTTVATPNIPEARELTGAGEGASQEELARGVVALGPKAVVVTGGHSEDMVDLFFDGERLVEIPGEKHPDGAAHGSGCTHSSALAAFLARRAEPLEAARWARRIASEAVGNGLREIGAGPGPVDALAIRERSLGP